MFDWFYEFLLSISITLFRLIDGLIDCANMLCGIESVNFKGEETDLLSYLLFSNEIGFAFRVSAILATILLVIFTVFSIIRSIVKDKAEGTPAQIAVKSFKTLLMFFLVPAVIVAFVAIGNVFVEALYAATEQNAARPGTFLFCAFAEDGGMPADVAELFRKRAVEGGVTYTYTDVELVSDKMNIDNFPFVFSWLAGGIVLFGIGSAMLVFVDRIISLVILYIAAPISISTSVLDDGARFKLWRDQFLSKFIMGYGMILAINIYALVCGLVMDPGFYFFKDSSFLNLLMKLLIIGGGAFTMQKSMALIGNLVSQGAGSNELRDNISAGGLARMARGMVGTPFSPLRSIVNDALAMKSRDIGASWLNKVGLGLSGGTSDSNGVKDPSGDGGSGGSGGSSGSQNNEKPNYSSNSGSDKTKEAIQGGFDLSWKGGNNSKGDKKDDNNANNDQSKQNKNDLVSNAINNGGEQGGNNNGNNAGGDV